MTISLTVLVVIILLLSAILFFAYLLIKGLTQTCKEQQAFIKQQMEFIQKNINEKVVYASPDRPYVSALNDDEPVAPVEEEVEEISAEAFGEIKSRKE